jgi:hypothetical protein
LNFDYTYIALGDFLVFEPMIIVTNTVFFALCILYYRRLSKFGHDYARQVAVFMLLLGISSIFGATGHAVHYQLGPYFFKGVVFMMNAFSLLAIYYNFRFTYTYATINSTQKRWVNFFVMTWVSVLLITSLVNQDFTLIKVHAGIALVYCLIVHAITVRSRNERGSMLIVVGIILSFLSIIVHTFRIMIGEWFNHKDIAHVLMIATLVLMFKGARLNMLQRGVTEQQAPAV